MDSAWTRPVDPQVDAIRAAIEELPSDMTWSATLHYYRHVHCGRPEYILIVNTWNWQTGRHVYFVPVAYPADLDLLLRRHSVRKDGFKTDIVTLHWSEFERRFPMPSRAILQVRP